MSSGAISVQQALGLFIQYLQGRIQGTPPALVNSASLVTIDPATGRWVYLSLPQMLSEAQRGTQIGVNEAIKYSGNQGFSVQG